MPASTLPDRLLTAEQLAEFLGVQVRRIYEMNAYGGGPPRIKIGSGKRARVRYRWSAVLAWMEANEVKAP